MATVFRLDLRFDGLDFIFLRLLKSRFGVEDSLLFNADEVFNGDATLRICAAFNDVSLARAFLGFVRDSRRVVRFDVTLIRFRRREIVFDFRILASAFGTVAQDRRNYTCGWGYWLFRAFAFCIFG